MRSRSTGWVRLRSAAATDKPTILFNYMSREEDRAEMRACVRLTREIFAQPAFDRYRAREIQPGEHVRTDEEIDAFIRAKAESAFHPSCTCKMGSASDPVAVVDSQTRVIGLEALQGRVAFAWPAMDAFYEEDERIVGHAADSYHRIDIRQTSRNLLVRHRDRIIADTKRPVVLYESGFAPRWYLARTDVDESALTPVEHQTFCPYKGLCGYYDIGDAHLAAWSYRDAYPEVGRISNFVSFEPDIVSVQLDGIQLRLEPGHQPHAAQ